MGDDAHAVINRGPNMRVATDAASGLTDPTCVPDVFIEGIGLIERVGENLRITLYATRNIGDGEVERVVVSRLVAPLGFVPIGVAQLTKAARGVPFMSAVK